MAIFHCYVSSLEGKNGKTVGDSSFYPHEIAGRQALLDMDAPRRALTELHPAKELLQRGREGWPLEVLKRNWAKNTV